jgi:hypothetical protein
MVGNQGKHMNLLTKLSSSIIIEPEEEKMLRIIITRQDKNLIRKWMDENKQDVKALLKSVNLEKGTVSKEELLLVTSKICCYYKIDISHRTVKAVIFGK